MFEGWVSSLLTRLLGSYVVEGSFSADKVQASVYAGHVVLQELELRRELLDSVQAPVRLERGAIGRVEFRIPWTKLGSRPVEITIDRVFLVLRPALEFDAAEFRRKRHARKKAELARAELAKSSGMYFEMNFEEENEDSDLALQRSLRNEAEELAKAGFTERLMNRIVDNIELTVKNVHVRYEDSVTNPEHAFALGMTWESLNMQSTDKRWKPCFVDLLKEVEKRLSEAGKFMEKLMAYKLFRLNHFSVYLDPLMPVRARAGVLDYESCTFTELAAHFERLLPRKSHQEEEDYRRVLREESKLRQERARRHRFDCTVLPEQDVVSEDEETEIIRKAAEAAASLAAASHAASRRRLEQSPHHCFLLEPMQVAMKLQSNRDPRFPDGPRTVLDIEVEAINFVFEKFQYVGLWKMITAFDAAEKSHPFGNLRPSDAELRHNPRTRWHFALKAILSQVEERRRRFSFEYLVKRRKDRLRYVELWKRNLVGRPASERKVGTPLSSSSRRTLADNPRGTAQLDSQAKLRRDMLRRGKEMSEGSSNKEEGGFPIFDDASVPFYLELNVHEKNVLESIEEEYPVQDVLFFRTLAENQLRLERAHLHLLEVERRAAGKASGGDVESWKGTIFELASWAMGLRAAAESVPTGNASSSSPSVNAKMSAEEKKKLLEILDFDPINVSGPHSISEATEKVYRLQIEEGRMQLWYHPEGVSHFESPSLLLDSHFFETKVLFSKRRNGSMRIRASLSNVEMFDWCSSIDRFARIVYAKESDGIPDNLSSYISTIGSDIDRASNLTPPSWSGAAERMESNYRRLRANERVLMQNRQRAMDLRRRQQAFAGTSSAWAGTMGGFESVGTIDVDKAMYDPAPDDLNDLESASKWTDEEFSDADSSLLQKRLGRDRQGGSRREKVFSLEVDIDNPKASADVCVRMRLCPLEIIYSPVCFAKVGDAFKIPDSVFTFKEAQLASINDLTTVESRNEAKIEYALRYHYSLSVNVDVQAPLVIFPELRDGEEQSNLVLVDFGRMSIKDKRLSQIKEKAAASKIPMQMRESKGRRMWFDGGDEEDSQFFDEYKISCSNVQVLVTNTGANWRSAKEQEAQRMHLVQRFSFDLVVAVSILQRDSTLPKLKLKASFPALHLQLNQSKIEAIESMLDSIERRVALEKRTHTHSKERGKAAKKVRDLVLADAFAAFRKVEEARMADSEQEAQNEVSSSMTPANLSPWSFARNHPGETAEDASRANFTTHESLPGTSSVISTSSRRSKFALLGSSKRLSANMEDGRQSFSISESLERSINDAAACDMNERATPYDDIEDIDFYTAAGSEFGGGSFRRKHVEAQSSADFMSAFEGPEFLGAEDMASAEGSKKSSSAKRRRGNANILQCSLSVSFIMITLTRPKQELQTQKSVRRSVRRMRRISLPESDGTDSVAADDQERIKLEPAEPVIRPYVKQWLSEVEEMQDSEKSPSPPIVPGKERLRLSHKEIEGSSVLLDRQDAALEDLLDGEHEGHHEDEDEEIADADGQPRTEDGRPLFEAEEGIAVVAIEGSQLLANLKALDTLVEFTLQSLSMSDVLGMDVSSLRLNRSIRQQLAMCPRIISFKGINESASAHAKRRKSQSSAYPEVERDPVLLANFAAAAKDSSIYEGVSSSADLSLGSVEIVFSQQMLSALVSCLLLFGPRTKARIPGEEIDSSSSSVTGSNKTKHDLRNSVTTGYRVAGIETQLAAAMSSISLTLLVADPTLSLHLETTGGNQKASSSSFSRQVHQESRKIAEVILRDMEVRMMKTEVGRIAASAQVGDLEVWDMISGIGAASSGTSNLKKESSTFTIPEQEELGQRAEDVFRVKVIGTERKPVDKRPLLLVRGDGLSKEARRHALQVSENEAETEAKDINSEPSNSLDLDELLESFLASSPPSSPTQHQQKKNLRPSAEKSPIDDRRGVPLPELPLDLDLHLQIRGLRCRLSAEFVKALVDYLYFGELLRNISALRDDREVSTQHQENQATRDASSPAEADQSKSRILGHCRLQSMLLNLYDIAIEIPSVQEGFPVSTLSVQHVTVQNRFFLGDVHDDVWEEMKQVYATAESAMHVIECFSASVTGLAFCSPSSASVLRSSSKLKILQDVDLIAQVAKYHAQAIAEYSGEQTWEWSLCRVSSDTVWSKLKLEVSPVSLRLSQSDVVSFSGAVKYFSAFDSSELLDRIRNIKGAFVTDDLYDDDDDDEEFVLKTIAPVAPLQMLRSSAEFSISSMKLELFSKGADVERSVGMKRAPLDSVILRVRLDEICGRQAKVNRKIFARFTIGGISVEDPRRDVEGTRLRSIFASGGKFLSHERPFAEVRRHENTHANVDGDGSASGEEYVEEFDLCLSKAIFILSESHLEALFRWVTNLRESATRQGLWPIQFPAVRLTSQAKVDDEDAIVTNPSGSNPTGLMPDSAAASRVGQESIVLRKSLESISVAPAHSWASESIAGDSVTRGTGKNKGSMKTGPILGTRTHRGESVTAWRATRTNFKIEFEEVEVHLAEPRRAPEIRFLVFRTSCSAHLELQSKVERRTITVRKGTPFPVPLHRSVIKREHPFSSATFSGCGLALVTKPMTMAEGSLTQQQHFDESNLVEPFNGRLSFATKTQQNDVGHVHNVDARWNEIETRITYHEVKLLSEMGKALSKSFTNLKEQIAGRSGAGSMPNWSPTTANEVMEEFTRRIHCTLAVERVKFSLVDDIVGQSAPVVECEVKSPEVTLQTGPAGMKILGSTEIGADYYNHRLGAWEPLLEAWSFRLHGLVPRLTNVDARSSFKIDSKDVLNINVTESLIETMSGASQIWNQDSSKTNFKRDSVSLFRIRNETGISIAYRTDKGQLMMSLGPRQEAPLLFEAKTSRSGRRLNDQGYRELTIGLYHPNGAGESPWHALSGIRVEREGSFTLRPSVTSKHPEVRAITLVCDVIPIGATKLVCIRSNLMVQNLCKVPMEVKLTNETNYEMALAPGEIAAVPVHIAEIINARRAALAVRPSSESGNYSTETVSLPVNVSSDCSQASTVRASLQFQEYARAPLFCALSCLSGIDALDALALALDAEDGDADNKTGGSSFWFMKDLASFQGKTQSWAKSTSERMAVRGVASGRGGDSTAASPSNSPSNAHSPSLSSRNKHRWSGAASLRLISFDSPVTITNLLATNASLRIREATTGSSRPPASSDGPLEIGKTLKWHGVDASRDIYLMLRLPGFDWSSTICVDGLPGSDEEWTDVKRQKDLRPSSFEQSIDLKDSNRRSLSVCIEQTILPGGMRTLVLYVPYWIVNVSDLHLLIRSASRSPSLAETFGGRIAAGQNEAIAVMRRLRMRQKLEQRYLQRRGVIGAKTPPGGLLDILDDEMSSRSRQGSEPLMFSYTDSRRKKGRICIKAADSAWSQPIGLDSAGTAGLIELKQQWNVTADRPRQVFMLGVSINVAEGAFHRTKVITLTPRFILINALGRTLKIKQSSNRSKGFTGSATGMLALLERKTVVRERSSSGTEGSSLLAATAETSEEIRPGARRPFHWMDSTSNREVSVRFDEYGWKWSGGFAIDQIGEYYVRLRNEHTHSVYILRVDVSLDKSSKNGSTILVTFRPELPSLPPYRIDNMSLQTLRLYQVR